MESLAQLADEAGISLVGLAIAFVIRHPAVTSAIIGRRTMAQLESQLPAAEVTVSEELLDRIDAVITPGATLNPEDNSYGVVELAAPARRR